MKGMIRINQVTKSFKDADRVLTVIDKLCFEFPPAGSVAIIGMSGVGKSTLLSLLGGLDTPTEGTIYIGDTEMSSLAPDERAVFRGNSIGFVFQFHHLLPEFSAVENVALALMVSGTEEVKAIETSAKLLEVLGLGSRLEHRPGTLSGGEQQRVAIARALVRGPKVVLADEPTGNLDSHTAEEVQRLLKSINKELNNLLVVVTHNRQLAESMDVMYEMLPGGKLEQRTG